MEFEQEPPSPEDQPRPQPVYLRPAEPPPPRKSPARRILTAIVAMLFVMSLLANVVLLELLAIGGALSSTTRPVKETYVQGAKDAVKKIAVIPVTGVLFKDESGMGNNAFSFAMAAVDKARKDKAVAAVILEVNSPGGGVAASDELHHEIERLARHKKVVVHFKDVAASGGYYISAPAHKIIASPTTITGSIGVRVSGLNIVGLAEKVGIKMNPITSGRHKDILSPWREMTEEEHKMIKDIVMELHEKFRKVILDGRGDRLTAAELSAVDDGRVFSGKQALEKKLVDAVGYAEDAIEAAADLAGLGKDAKVVRYRRQVPFLRMLLSSRSESAQTFSLELLASLAGREPFLYLWMMPQGAVGR